MYKTIKTFGHDLGLSCCFRQWRATHSHCRFLHGYAIAVELVIGTERLDERNWCFDFGAFKPIKQWLTDTFDHKMIVAEDDPHLDDLCALAGIGAADVLVLPQVGCERFAFYIFDAVQGMLKELSSNGAVLLEVTVREHGANAASYSRTTNQNHV